jgi:hypothetical protein
MNNKTKDLLDKLHQLIGEELVNRIVSDEASTGDIVAAIRFLKDNGVTSVIAEDSPLQNLAEILPFKLAEGQ